MYLHVFCHIPIVSESSIADIACKRHFARMEAHVYFDGVRISERFLAHLAGVRFLAGVASLMAPHNFCAAEHIITNVALEHWRLIRMAGLLMCSQSSGRCETLLALVAREGLDTGVDYHVRHQLWLDAKTFLANFTLIEQFTGMHLSHVQQAVTAGAKRSVTFCARIWLISRMDPHMGLQQTVYREFFITVAADKRLCRIVHTPFVLAKTILGGEELSALRTCDRSICRMCGHMPLQSPMLRAFVIAFGAGEWPFARMNAQMQF